MVPSISKTAMGLIFSEHREHSIMHLVEDVVGQNTFRPRAESARPEHRRPAVAVVLDRLLPFQQSLEWRLCRVLEAEDVVDVTHPVPRNLLSTVVRHQVAFQVLVVHDSYPDRLRREQMLVRLKAEPWLGCGTDDRTELLRQLVESDVVDLSRSDAILVHHPEPFVRNTQAPHWRVAFAEVMPAHWMIRIAIDLLCVSLCCAILQNCDQRIRSLVR